MLNKKDKKYKEYLKLVKKVDEVGTKFYRQELVKLDEPYQCGWEIIYDVREDIKRREDYPYIKELIELSYYPNYTRNVNLVRAIRRKENSFQGKRGIVLVNSCLPHRKDLYKEDLVNLKLNKWYELDERHPSYIKYKREIYKLTLPSYWLVLKVKPYIVTHTRGRDAELESEYDKLRKELYFSGKYDKFIPNYGSSYPAYKDRTKLRDSISKFKNGQIDDIYNEKIPLIYDW